MRLKRLWILWLVYACFATVAKAQDFCGPNTVTYYRVDSAAGGAVMCVLFVDRNSFTFYAQGTEHGKTFRLLGYSHRGNYVVGPYFHTDYASINGNGEQFTQAPSNRWVTYILDDAHWDEHDPPYQIYLHIMESEGIWERYYYGGSPTSAVPTLPPIRTCGGNLKAFSVEGRPGEVRCLLKTNDHDPAAWLGAGTYQGKQYLHIGTAFFGALGARWGASDICLPGFYCGRVNFGGLNLNSSPGGGFGRGTIGGRGGSVTRWFITGAWTETWAAP